MSSAGAGAGSCGEDGAGETSEGACATPEKPRESEGVDVGSEGGGVVSEAAVLVAGEEAASAAGVAVDGEMVLAEGATAGELTEDDTAVGAGDVARSGEAGDVTGDEGSAAGTEAVASGEAGALSEKGVADGIKGDGNGDESSSGVVVGGNVGGRAAAFGVGSGGGGGDMGNGASAMGL